jgi:ATP-dependent DNA helicase RecG
MLSVISGEMTRGQIQEKLGLRDEKHFRENYQQVAVKLGLIEMSIPDKPRSSKQKYRLTAKGLAVVQSSKFESSKFGGDRGED